MQDEKDTIYRAIFGWAPFPCGLRKCLIAYWCRKK